MGVAYLAVTSLVALAVTASAVFKIRRDPNVVKVIHDVVGVPMEYFWLLVACELAGALGLVAGIWWPPLGIAAGIGLVLYFVGACVAHLRVGDVKGVGPAAFMLFASGAALATRLLTS